MGRPQFEGSVGLLLCLARPVKRALRCDEQSFRIAEALPGVFLLWL